MPILRARKEDRSQVVALIRSVAVHRLFTRCATRWQGLRLRKTLFGLVDCGLLFGALKAGRLRRWRSRCGCHDASASVGWLGTTRKVSLASKTVEGKKRGGPFRRAPRPCAGPNTSTCGGRASFVPRRDTPDDCRVPGSTRSSSTHYVAPCLQLDTFTLTRKWRRHWHAIDDMNRMASPGSGSTKSIAAALLVNEPNFNFHRT